MSILSTYNGTCCKITLISYFVQFCIHVFLLYWSGIYIGKSIEILPHHTNKLTQDLRLHVLIEIRVCVVELLYINIIDSIEYFRSR